MQNTEDAQKIAQIIGRVFSASLVDLTENLITLESEDRKRFMITVVEVTSPDTHAPMIDPVPGHLCADPFCGGCCSSCDCPDCTAKPAESDDDGDDDERPADPESFDGGYGHGSYFQQAMSKDD